MKGEITSSVTMESQGDVAIGILWAPFDAVKEVASTADMNPVLSRRATELGSSGGAFHLDCDGQFMLSEPLETRMSVDLPIQSYHLTFSARFPLEFQIPLTEPPPDAAVATQTSHSPDAPPFRLAMGLVFAYRDRNLSHAFEPGTPETIHDAFLATSQVTAEEYVLVVFLEGQIPQLHPDYRTFLQDLPQGYSIVSVNWESRVPGSGGVDILPGDSRVRLSIEGRTSIPDQSVDWACGEYLVRFAPYLEPFAPEELTCVQAEGTLNFTAVDQDENWNDPNLCIKQHKLNSGCVGEGETPPDGWPCESYIEG